MNEFDVLNQEKASENSSSFSFNRHVDAYSIQKGKTTTNYSFNEQQFNFYFGPHKW